MAATSTAFAAATGASAAVATAGGDASRLASGNSFQTTSMVQFVPLRQQRSNRVVAARASLSEDSKSIQKDVIVSIIAAGAALGLSVSVIDGAFANPIEAAKTNATTTLNSVKSLAPTLPSAPNPGGAFEDAKKGADNIASDIRDRIDGIFGKDRPGPFSRNSVASTNGGTGSALGDAKKRILSFGKNPIAENIEKGSEQASKNIASAPSPKPNAQRVDEATKKVGKFGSDFQKKGSNALSEGKSFLGDKAQGSVPALPELLPKIETPNLPTPDTSKLEDLKIGAQSKAGEARRAVDSAIGQ